MKCEICGKKSKAQFYPCLCYVCGECLKEQLEMKLKITRCPVCCEVASHDRSNPYYTKEKLE
jgi:hypothetical protein